MKGSIAALIILFLSYSAAAQTVIFDEDFETTPLSVTASSSGTSPSWAINSNFQTSGMNSDSAVVQTGDSLFLETDSFNTIGYSFVSLSFNHICKISFFDKGIVEYSLDNGGSWTQLTSSEYMGSALVFASQNSFSAVSYSNWDIANNSAIPTQSWWQSEQFDLSSIVGNSGIKVRFVLIDADNNGAVNNYGWLLDDIEIIGSPCELIPPTINLSGNILQNQVYSTGPYTIEADIQDLSGVNSARLVYTKNGGSPDTVNMTNTSSTTYQGTVPSAALGDTICYYIFATDGSSCANRGRHPSNSCVEFEVKQNPPPTCIGTPVSNYDYLESFATFTAGNGSSTVGTLRNSWENSTADDIDWFVFNRGTTSTNTGPSADHSPGDANYLYVEATGRFNQEAILNTPCYDLDNLLAPEFSFWYHMWGINQGELHVDVFFGNQWVLDIMPPILGDQGNQWLQRTIDLTPYIGNIIKLRFRAETGNGFRSDIAIDDIEITEPALNEMRVNSIVSPSDGACNGSSSEFVTIEVENLGAQTQDTIPLSYSINNGPIVIDTFFTSLSPSGIANHTFQQPFNMSAAGVYNIDVWVNLPQDTDRSNDSLLNYAVSSSTIYSNFPDTTTFDNFTTGTPGNFVDDWYNDTNDDHDWWVNSGGTNSQFTGPSSDTISGSGNYVYMEATNYSNGVVANLQSKCYDLSNMNRAELKFYYHMYGADMGELHFDVLINGFLINDIVQPIIGDQGDRWVEKVIDLSPFSGVVKVIFRAVRGNGFRSDIALDGVIVYDALPVSIAEKKNAESQFTIYPNPVNEVLFINLNANSQTSSEVVIYDAVGKLLQQKTLSTGKHQFDFSAYKKGVYYLRLMDNSGNTETKKIIKY